MSPWFFSYGESSRPWNDAMHATSLQSRPTPCDPMNCSLPGSSVHGILQARILEWVAMLSSRGLSPTQVSNLRLCIGGGFFTTSTTWEAHGLKYSTFEKECIWVSSNEVDEPRAYHTEWNKSERQNKYCILMHIYPEKHLFLLYWQCQNLWLCGLQ